MSVHVAIVNEGASFKVEDKEACIKVLREWYDKSTPFVHIPLSSGIKIANKKYISSILAPEELVDVVLKQTPTELYYIFSIQETTTRVNVQADVLDLLPSSLFQEALTIEETIKKFSRTQPTEFKEILQKHGVKL